MIARKYLPEDFDQIQLWAKEWGTNYKPSQFPKTGFIVDGLAAWFLYRTDSSVCFLENLISKKSADERDRDEAIKLVVDAVLTEARDQGFSVAYATTDIPAVVIRAMQYGATGEAKQVLLTKRLDHDPSE